MRGICGVLAFSDSSDASPHQDEPIAGLAALESIASGTAVDVVLRY